MARLTATAVGLSVVLAAFAAPARAEDRIGAENRALRAQNRELQARLDERNALAEDKAGAAGEVQLIDKGLSHW